jgi:hypothetical protein
MECNEARLVGRIAIGRRRVKPRRPKRCQATAVHIDHPLLLQRATFTKTDGCDDSKIALNRTLAGALPGKL